MFDVEILKLLGPETEEDKKRKEEANLKKRKNKKKKAKQQKQQKKKGVKKSEDEFAQLKKEKLSKIVARDMISSLNTQEVLKEYHKKFGDTVITRFPPEPNGYLHIGHAKAMRFSFGLSRDLRGYTNLRMDDTNPEKECKEYIDNIHENVKWLGYKPRNDTFASEYFEQLYQYACQLIKVGKAFACFQNPKENQKTRKEGKPSPYRNTSPEENLKIFQNMRKGMYEEGEVCLKLKIDYKHKNMNLRDPPCYRIRYTPHPHVGDKWCIYPLYDFTHGISDSIEGITHSLCTLEFENRRDLYYWILNELNIYKPYVYEFSRLNISNTVLSKRKLHKLVHEHIVEGWDDPRIYTLNGLRRRGYTADAVNDFCDFVGVTRRGNENIISHKLLEHCLRQDLNEKAPRTMTIVNPFRLIITNVEDSFNKVVKAPYFPADKTKGYRDIHFTKNVWLDLSDCCEYDN